jgi:hypothetical protein
MHSRSAVAAFSGHSWAVSIVLGNVFRGYIYWTLRPSEGYLKCPRPLPRYIQPSQHQAGMQDALCGTWLTVRALAVRGAIEAGPANGLLWKKPVVAAKFAACT